MGWPYDGLLLCSCSSKETPSLPFLLIVATSIINSILYWIYILIPSSHGKDNNLAFVTTCPLPLQNCPSVSVFPLYLICTSASSMLEYYLSLTMNNIVKQSGCWREASRQVHGTKYSNSCCVYVVSNWLQISKGKKEDLHGFPLEKVLWCLMF